MELLITIGPWQSLFACAALWQLGVKPEDVEVIVVHEISEENLVEPCRRIHESQGHCFLGGMDIRTVSKGSFSGQQRELLKRISKARRIWCGGLGGKARWLVEYLPMVPLVTYEDGLISMSASFAYGSAWEQSWWQRFYYRVRKSASKHRPWLRREDFRRLDLIVTSLDEIYPSQDAPRARRLRVEPESLRTVLNAGWCPAVEFPAAVKPRALVLGSNFTKVDIITPSQEYGAIERTIELLSERYEVWWKAHPRADPLYTRYLQLRHPALKTLDEQVQWVPVEAFIPKADFQLLVSPMSSSLLYAKKIYGVETRFSPGFGELLATLNNQEFVRIYRWLRKYISVLE